jgi:outer membrane protein OmpA-like peptidoglycan-associated protein
MPGSVFSSLISTVDSRSVGAIASRFGAPERAVSQGLEMSSATLLTGLANKAGDSTWMNRLFQLVSQAPSNVNASDMTSAALDPGRAPSGMSSLLDSGKNFLAHIFGSNQSPIYDAVASSTGLGSNIISTLMSIGAPLMMSALGRLVRDDRMDPAGLGRVLTHEAEDVRGMLPPRVSALVGATSATAEAPPPLAINTVREEPAAAPPLSVRAIPEPRRRSLAWLWIIPLALLGLFLWGIRGRHPVVTGVRPTVAPTAPTAPGRVVVNVIQDPAAGRLLAYIQNTSMRANRATQFDFDRVLFATGSSTLLPAARGQLDDISRIMTAYPNVRLLIVGHTDNTGGAALNQRLSEARANAVKSRLAALGISPDRLETQGSSYNAPTANNGTANGRAMNRRVSVAVIEK